MNEKHFLAIAACLAAGAAAAADLPASKAPPPSPPPAFTWTGPYVGLSIGRGWADANRIDGVALDPALAPTGSFWVASSPNASGVSGGVQVGYNYQINGTGLVVGLETDFLGADIRGDRTIVGAPVAGTPILPFITTHQSLDWFGAARGRLGYAILPNLLIYGAGGFAYGQTSSNFVIGFANGFFDSAFDRVARTGWTAGAGVEWAFMSNLSLRFQYLYIDLGNGSALWDACRGCNDRPKPPVPPPAPVAPAAFISGQTATPNRFHNVTVGLNYRFNLFGDPGAAPVLGSY